MGPSVSTAIGWKMWWVCNAAYLASLREAAISATERGLWIIITTITIIIIIIKYYYYFIFYLKILPSVVYIVIIIIIISIISYYCRAIVINLACFRKVFTSLLRQKWTDPIPYLTGRNCVRQETHKNKKDGYRQLNVRQLGSLRPWDHRGKCYMDRKRIQCLSNALQYVPIYLQPFLRYSGISVASDWFSIVIVSEWAFLTTFCFPLGTPLGQSR